MEFLSIILGIAIYVLPTIISYKRDIKDKGTLMLINVFLGWTTIAWIITLIWSFSGKKEGQEEKSIKDEESEYLDTLTKLAQLKSLGALSEDEFKNKKSELDNRFNSTKIVDNNDIKEEDPANSKKNLKYLLKHGRITKDRYEELMREHHGE